MKNSKFNPLFETIYSRFKDGSGFLAGDVVKFKSDYKNTDQYKKLSENIKQRIDDMIKAGNNIRVGRLHNRDASFGALGGAAEPASLADLYEEVAPSFWRNLVTVPVELLETNNPAIDLPPVPDSQKDKPRAYVKPIEAKNDKANKGPEINEQTKTGKKQTHADKGDYELATKNTKLANANKYNDAEPPKVKGTKKPKELKESVEDVYGKMLTEGFDSDEPSTYKPVVRNRHQSYSLGDAPSVGLGGGHRGPWKPYTPGSDIKGQLRDEYNNLTPELKQQIVDAWNNSKKNAAQIAQDLRISPSTVSRVLSDVGILPEDAEGPQTWTDEDVGAMGSGSNAESLKNEETTVADESGLQAYLGKKKYGAKDFKALQKAGRDHNEKKKEEIKAKHSKADSKQ